MRIGIGIAIGLLGMLLIATVATGQAQFTPGAPYGSLNAGEEGSVFVFSSYELASGNVTAKLFVGRDQIGQDFPLTPPRGFVGWWASKEELEGKTGGYTVRWEPDTGDPVVQAVTIAGNIDQPPIQASHVLANTMRVTLGLAFPNDNFELVSRDNKITLAGRVYTDEVAPWLPALSPINFETAPTDVPLPFEGVLGCPSTNPLGGVKGKS